MYLPVEHPSSAGNSVFIGQFTYSEVPVHLQLIQKRGLATSWLDLPGCAVAFAFAILCHTFWSLVSQRDHRVLPQFGAFIHNLSPHCPSTCCQHCALLLALLYVTVIRDSVDIFFFFSLLGPPLQSLRWTCKGNKILLDSV